MVFSSITFVYAFFPLVAVAYYLSKNRVYRNVVLLLASLLFYSWGEPRFLLLMLAATLAAYCGGLLMERSTAHKRLILIVTVVLLVGNLFVFKYLNFFSENLSALFGWSALPKLTLPIGISFYTFQILSYVIDLYRGEIRVQRNYFYLLLYVSFFPQLIAGPIVRYETVEQEILERRESIDDVAAGLRRFILGLAKKVILANNIARIAETIYAGDSAVYGTALYWLAAVAYALQIYFDFSGYSDMAIGLGRMFGFHFLENFDHPYTALSITDFWRRWHISLSTWFRDYVYIPLGGNRVKKSRWIRNILVVWALTGFWHGAQWNFLFWGLYYGLLLLAEKLFLGRLLERLQEQGSLALTEACALTGASVATTRRDFELLQEKGLAQRTHGGLGRNVMGFFLCTHFRLHSLQRTAQQSGFQLFGNGIHRCHIGFIHLGNQGCAALRNHGANLIHHAGAVFRTVQRHGVTKHGAIHAAQQNTQRACQHAHQSTNQRAVQGHTGYGTIRGLVPNVQHALRIALHHHSVVQLQLRAHGILQE